MYEEYFGLERRPFAATPDVSCAYLPESIQEVLNELLLRVEAGQGIALLTAPAGTGKTFLCRRLAAELSDKIASIYIGSANFPTRRAMFQAILYELGANYTGLDEQELRLELQSQFKKFQLEGQSLLLILDEAHLLNARLLEEVRSLTDLSENGQALVRVLVSGQPALEERLITRELDAFNQRLACHVFLEPFTRVQAREYVLHRIRWAGGDATALFAEEALELIAHGSNGVPRCINQLCDHSLLLSFVAETSQVTRALVEDALNDLKQLPLHWNDVLPAAGPLDSLRDSADSPEESEMLADEAPEVPAALPAALETTASDDPYIFEIGAEPEEYQLSNPVAERPVATVPAVDNASADEKLTAEEIATPDKDVVLTRLMHTPVIPFPSVPSRPCVVTSTSEREGCDQDDRDWEPVVEDIVPDVTEDSGIEASQRQLYDPLRHGVVPLVDTPIKRFGGFQDEVVVDRYASIDAVVRGEPGNSLNTPQFNPVAGLSRGKTDLPGIPGIPGPTNASGDAATMTALPPDQLIDRLMPLLDAAVNNSEEVNQSLSLSTTQATLPNDAEPEEAVGGEVLDLCLNVQDFFTQEMARQTPAVEAEHSSTSAGYETSEQEAGFDVIEPEPESTAPNGNANRFTIDSQHTVNDRRDEPGAHPLLPRPNYRRVFSLLRRKLGR